MAGALRRLDSGAQDARSGLDHLDHSVGFTGRTGFLLFISDLVFLAGGIIAGFWLVNNFRSAQPIATAWLANPSSIALSAALPLALSCLFWLAGHYGRRRARWNISIEILFPTTAAMVAHALLLKAACDIAPLTTAVSWSFGGILLIAARRINRDILFRVGRWHQPAIIVGSNADTRWLELEMKRTKDLTIRAEARLQYDPVFSPDISAARLSALLAAYPDRHILISPSRTDAASVKSLLSSIAPVGNRASIILPYSCFIPAQDLHVRKHILPDRSTIVTPHSGLSNPLRSTLKRAMDILGSLLFLTLFAPLFGSLSMAGIFGRGRIFFGHRRIGRYGKPFSCYKFRTMVPNGEEVLKEILARDPAARLEWESSYKLKNDPRVTRLGGFLRKTSLDELPQLWNVLKGDMSLVGPRPIIEDELRYYGDHTLEYFSVRPGMTGLWQVSGRSDTSYETRVDLDTMYVRNWSMRADLHILINTARVVFVRGGAY